MRKSILFFLMMAVLFGLCAKVDATPSEGCDCTRGHGNSQGPSQCAPWGFITGLKLTRQSDDGRLMDCGAQNLSQLAGFCYGMGRDLEVIFGHK